VRGKNKRKKKRHNAPPNTQVAIPARVDQEMPTEPDHSTDRNDDKKKTMGFLQLIKSDPKFRVEVSAVAVGLFVLLVYGCQLRVMQKQLAFSAEQMKSDQRAWVGVKDFQVERYGPKQIFKMKVVLSNSGKTPSVNMHRATQFMFSPTIIAGPPPEYVNMLKFEAGGTVPPNGEPVLHIDDEPDAAVSSKYEFLRDKKLFLYIFGEVDYEDIFGKPHFTKFCFYLVDSGPTVDTAFRGLAYCDAFNDMN
jgi:hypothetical protein